MMSPNFDLVITADTPSLTAEFRLLDGDGSQLAYRQTDFKTIAVVRRQGLFDLRNYLRNYVEEGKEAASVAEIGVCIAEEVLGQEIFLKLWESNPSARFASSCPARPRRRTTWRRRWPACRGRSRGRR